MKYEIVRVIQNMVFPDGFEEEYAPPKEFDTFQDALKDTRECLMFDIPEFIRIDEGNEIAEFISKNRMRYAGDLFILRKSKE